MKSPQKPIPRGSPKKASKGFQWSTAKRSKIKKKPRKPSETLRIYGGKKRIEFVKSLPCAACGVEGYSENAHLTPKPEKGAGYKGDAKWIAPMCGVRPTTLNRTGTYIGCHILFDRHRSILYARFPDFNPEKAAAETQAAWLEHSQEKA